MHNAWTDAELIAVLQAVEKHGSTPKAAPHIGKSESTVRQAVRTAKARGLTAGTPVQSEVDKLKVRLQAAERAAKDAARERDTAEIIREAIYNLAQFSPEPPAWLTKDGKPGSRGAPVTIWSDWHDGEVVRAEEVGGVNEFNHDICVTRVKKLVDVTIDLAYNHMGRAKTEYPGCVVMLGGDMMTGDIHEELLASNDRTPQQSINDLTDLIAGALDTMAGKFGKLFVPCVVGNHGRATRKPRMKGRVFTSYEWNIYCNLERYFRKTKNVHFMIPGETDAYFSVFGHRYLLTHGDSLGVKGGDGIIGAMGPIMRGAIKVGRSEAQIGRDFDTIVMGHWHQYLTFPGVIVNNALKGYDEFARLALRAPYSRPSQALWFTHPEHGITAHWQVFLEGLRKSNDRSKWVEFQAA